ncbi:PaaX family transcriptional regulator C-terminal domain-containing protein [Nocardioides sp.]|uniref:PaaX family transcriptional regulator n=1 Tax=Nocardioides sp. TaxID=35761 RepID=UPI002D807A7A|nr:PaaX family transcriptional regulator C-terminal domain-containing protein [Nocardioides sp.]
MTTAGQVARPVAALRSRTVLVTFLGSVVRHLGSWMPIAGTVELTSGLGLDTPSVRTAVSRLKKRGWLLSETRAGVRGYGLSTEALASLAAGDQVIWHARQPADLADGWCVITFSIPETARGRRDRLRSHLSALGFGNVSTATWIAPARMQAAAEQAIAELDLMSFCAVFTGSYVAGPDLPALVARSWDLPAMDARYRTFLARFADAAPEPGAVIPADAFATYVTMVDHWRQLPFRDPALPPDLLPANWTGGEALALFERRVTQLEDRALAHAATYWP